MFDKQYRFRGSHAEKVNKLTAYFCSASKAKVFERNLDVYINAPLIGFLYGKRADLDEKKNPDTGQVFNENIMGEQVIHASEELIFNFRLIMLLDDEYEPNEDARVDKAFRNMGDNKSDEERFDSYVRGGVDVLYEKLIEEASGPEEIIERLYTFLDDFNDRFNSAVSCAELISLCGKSFIEDVDNV